MMVRIDICQCRDCGYDLTGLPAAGRCPECGQSYHIVSRRGIVNPGNQEQRIDWLLRRARTVALSIATILVITCASAGSFLVPDPTGLLMTGGLLTVLLAMGAVTSYLYEKDTE